MHPTTSAHAALAALPAWPPALDAAVFARTGWRDAQDVREACRRGTVRDLLGGDERAQRELSRALTRVPSLTPPRALARARRVAERVLEHLEQQPEAVRLVVTGALRRMEPEVAVVDLLATAVAPPALLEALERAPFVRSATRTPTTVHATLDDGSAVHLEVLAEDAHTFVLAQCERTGPDAHVRALRTHAAHGGWTWGPRLGRAGREAPLEVESDLYGVLGVPYVPPERRHAATVGTAEPAWVEAADLQGLARVHSEAGEGRFPLATWADAATRQEFAWLLVADRTWGPGPHLGPHLGADDDAPRRAANAWAAARPVPDDPDGAPPPAPTHVLLGRLFDLAAVSPGQVAAALDRTDMTFGALRETTGPGGDAGRDDVVRRAVAAIASGHVDVFVHPPASPPGGWGGTWDDWAPVVAALAAVGGAVELAGSPGRLVLPAGWREGVVAAGLPVLLAADEHQPGDLDAALAALGLARRQGWARDGVMNTWTHERLRAWVRTRRRAP